MDLKEQLKQIFPDHQIAQENVEKKTSSVFLQELPLICKYEKRNGKPVTIIENYNGATSDFKILTKEIKTKFSVGGSFKNKKIIIQGYNRDQIMVFLKNKGFNVKRVGG